MDATISAQISQIAKELAPLHSLAEPWYKQPDFIGAALGSFVAVAVAYVGWLYNSHFADKTDVIPLRIEPYNQSVYITTDWLLKIREDTWQRM